MPELPEVQTTVDGLKKKIIKRRITGVWFDAPKLITLRIPQGDGEQSRTIKKPKLSEFEKQIKGLIVTDVRRRGKNILIYLKKDTDKYRLKRINTNRKIRINQLNPHKSAYLLLIHQKMTGHLLYGKWDIRKGRPSPIINGPLQEKVNDYIHIIFHLDNGFQFALSDLRKFAKVLFGEKNEIENSPDLAKIGPDPLDKDFTFEKFKKILSGKSGRIKKVLMNQEVISGIGNIYSDEILWSAKVSPSKETKKLNPKELKNIYLETLRILKRAVKLKGTSISDYRDFSGKPGSYANELLVYRKGGQPCKRCGTPIKRIKMGGRSAHFCPKCQR